MIINGEEFKYGIDDSFEFAIQDINLEEAKQLILNMNEEELNGICYWRHGYYLLHTIIGLGNPEIINELCKFVIPKLNTETLYETAREYKNGKHVSRTALDFAIEKGYPEVAQMLIDYMFIKLDHKDNELQELNINELNEIINECLKGK